MQRGYLSTHRQDAVAAPEAVLSVDARYEQIVRIVGAFAHHFNNLLTPVLGYADLILARPSCAPETCSDAETILRAAERAASMIDRLLNFAGRSRLNPQLLDLNALVSGMAPRIMSVIGPGIDFETRLDPAARRIYADPGQAEGLLLDLVANACEAMPRGGRLVVKTSGIESGRCRLRHGVKVAPGSYTALTVRDTGVGMDAECRARVFEPFFTTKQGAPGLGLSSAYGFVKRSGGFIWIAGAPGKGALATVCFPCAEPGCPETGETPA
ncbi:MAG: ATP-binding protein [Thermodesulfobacteriota bacterium]